MGRNAPACVRARRLIHPHVRSYERTDGQPTRVVLSTKRAPPFLLSIIPPIQTEICNFAPNDQQPMNKQDWTYKKLGEVTTKISDGSHNPPKGIDYSEYPMLSSKNVFFDCFNYDSPRYLSKEEFDLENKRTDISDGDILLTIVGTVGRTCCVKNPFIPFVLQRSVAVLKPKRSIIESRFLMYALHSLSDFWNIEAKGVAQKGIYLKQLATVPIPVPPLAEQERIVAELDLLQGIIEKKKEQLKAYDQLAQSIFYSMFGDPIDNPKGWEVKKLGEVGTIVAGSTPSTNDESNWDGDINWVTPAELREQLYYGETARKLTEKGAKGLTLMPVGTVLLSSRAPIGKLAITTSPMCCNQGFKNIICDNIINNVFLYYYLKNTMDLIQALGRGATFKEVSKNAISSYKVFVPPLSLQQEFAEKIEAIERQKALVQQSIDETQTMFDYTMDKYFG